MSSKVMVAVGALAAGTGLFVASCSTSQCGAGTHLVGETCVADPFDASVPAVDASCPAPGTPTTCGLNTAMNGTICDITAAACGPGTKLDPVSKICQIPKENGTLVGQSRLIRTWHNYSWNNPSPADGGTAYPVVGNRFMITDTNVTDATKLFMSSKLPTDPTPDPLGKLIIPVHWFSQVGSTASTTPTAIDHQITVGEWKKCTANYAMYKNPPSGKKTYKMVVEMTGCPPDLSWSIWNFYSNSDNLKDRVVAVPSGGLPNAFNINGDGTGYWEREEDPNAWFKAGLAINGASHLSGRANKIPDLTEFPNATFYIDLAFHNNGQSNGNAGFCEKDTSTNCNGGPCCVTPPSKNVFLPGQFGIDVAGAFGGARIDGDDVLPVAERATPIPLSMLQPY